MPASIERPLPLRVRPDLIVQPLDFGGRRYFGVKDPITLKYFQLREEEHFILQRLDGRTSLETIRRQFERTFAPKRLSAAQVQAFLGMLHHDGLVFSDSPGQSTQLLNRGAAAWRKAVLSAAGNILAIRFRGIDPEPFLTSVEPWCRWLFSPLSAIFFAALVLSAIGLVAVEFETLRSRLPELSAFFGLRNVIWMMAVLAVIKVFHEIGHALTCRHFGGECHELGLMLLVFTPALYCNVSDSWMLPSKWHRIAISGAGMAVELVLAAVCTWLWWFSEPGVLNTLCLNVMFVGSINTLLFNGNPLLRYDGYYILSDLVEIPNLREQSQAVVRQVLGRFFLGIQLHAERMLPPKGHAFLFVYGVAATIYRWVVLLGILWFLHVVLRIWRLEVIAQWIAILTVGSQVIVSAVQATRFVRETSRRHRVRWGRLLVRLAGVGLVAAGILFTPLPYPLTAPAVLQPKDAVRIYAAVPGTLKHTASVGQQVAAGDTLAELDDPDVQMDVVKLQGERDRLELRLKQLRLRQGTDPEAGAQMNVTHEALQDATERLAQRTRDRDRLTVAAPISGTVFSPRWKREHAAPGDLPAWQGDALDPKNRGAWLAAGTMLCLVGKPQQLEAVLVVDQTDVDLIRRDQRVALHLDEYPGDVLHGTIVEIAQVELEAAPSELAVQGDLATRNDPSGAARPRSTSYQARVRLEDAPQNLTANASGWGTIHVASQSLAAHIGRYLSRTFRFETGR